MIKCRENHTFENWAKTLTFKPKSFCQPKTEQDVVDIVRAARASGTCVTSAGRRAVSFLVPIHRHQ